MTAAIETAIPQATHHSEHVRCNHGQDITGYVVTYSRFDRATGDTSFEDIAYVQGSTSYGDALDMVRDARERITSGQVDATYAVIHTVYENGHRPY